MNNPFNQWRALVFCLLGHSKARCACSYLLPRFLNRKTKGHVLVVLDDREFLGIVAALQIERLVLRTVDMDHRPWY